MIVFYSILLIVSEKLRPFDDELHKSLRYISDAHWAFFVFALLAQTSTNHTGLLFIFQGVCVFCMAMSSPVLLTRVIFIVSISTFAACWAGLEDLSKLTSEQQHFHRRGLFTQTRRRPLNSGDISSILLPILAEIVLVLHSAGVQLRFQLPKALR